MFVAPSPILRPNHFVLFCSTYTFLTYVNGWATETGKFVAFVPHFTLGRCVERGRNRAQIFDLFRNSEVPGSIEFLQRLMSLRAMSVFRDSGAAAFLVEEFRNATFLDHLGSVVQFYVDFTVGVLNNYTMTEQAYGCLMPKSQKSQFVYDKVSDVKNLNPVALNTTAVQEEDSAIFCGHLGVSINCIEFDYEKCLSKILLPMQTDGLLPFRNTQRYNHLPRRAACEALFFGLSVACYAFCCRIPSDSFHSRLRYTSFSSWCHWHLPQTQNSSGLHKSQKLHACNSCRQAARICSKFPDRVISAEISLNCSTRGENLEPAAEFSQICDDASDITFCTVWYPVPREVSFLPSCITPSFLQVTNRLCVRSAVDPLCAKHDVVGNCFNSVMIDPSSLNSGQRVGETPRAIIHCFLLIFYSERAMPGYQDQTPRLNLKFNITT